MMDWAGAGLLLLLVPLLMCAVMMIGGVALAVFGFRRSATTAERDSFDEASGQVRDSS